MGDVIIKGKHIDGVTVTPLMQIEDERGMVMHMLREDSPEFERFGEVYFSYVNQNAVKAWKMHKKMTQFYAVPVGTIKLVIYDDRDNSKTSGSLMEIITGIHNYGLVRVPPNLWYGFTGISHGGAMIVNCASIPHDPEESVKMNFDNGPVAYDWTRQRL